MTSAYMYSPSQQSFQKSVKTGTQFLAAMSAAGGALAAGMLMAWSSPAQARVVSGALGIKVSEHEFSWIGSLLPLGAACVCIPIGCLIDIIGRKLTILLLLIPLLLGWILLLWDSRLWTMCVGRLLMGMSMGGFCLAAPLYTGEITQEEIRWELCSFFQLMITAGVLFAYCVGAVTKVLDMSLICAIFPLPFFAVFIFMPESPVFLMKKHKTGRAIAAMKFLRGRKYDHMAELNAIRELEAESRLDSAAMWQALKRRSTVRGLIISVGLRFFQQMSGVYAIIFYCTDIFKVF